MGYGVDVMDVNPGTEENVIAVDFDPDKERPAFKTRKRRDHKCAHKYVTIDEITRAVTCRDCEADLDPVEAMLDIAKRWGWLQTNAEFIRARNEQAAKQLKEVERQLRNAKARLRRVGGGS